MPPGWLHGSIYWVLLVSGWLAVSQTIIPDAQEHFLTASTRRHTHLFGGLGLSGLTYLATGKRFSKDAKGCFHDQEDLYPVDESFAFTH